MRRARSLADTACRRVRIAMAADAACERRSAPGRTARRARSRYRKRQTSRRRRRTSRCRRRRPGTPRAACRRRDRSIAWKSSSRDEPLLDAVDHRQLGVALLGLLQQSLRLVEQARVLERHAHAAATRLSRRTSDSPNACCARSSRSAIRPIARSPLTMRHVDHRVVDRVAAISCRVRPSCAYSARARRACRTTSGPARRIASTGIARAERRSKRRGWKRSPWS